MKQEELLDALFSLRDENYRLMLLRLIPNIPRESIIGVRTPELRRLAKELEDGESFLNSLPHRYFEENQVHSFLLEKDKDFEAVISRVEDFLPHVDNWATCDQLSPKVFRKHRGELLPHSCRWVASDHPYTIRFMVRHSGHAACTPWAAASPASAEVRHPLKESMAITIFFMNLL